MGKKVFWAIVGAILLAVAVFGGRTVVSYVATGKRLVMQEAQARVPFRVEIERLRTMVAGLDDTVLRHEKRLIEQEVDLEYLQKEVARRESALRQAENSLKEVRNLLAENRPVYVIGGRSYAAEDLRRDALARVDAYRGAREVLDVRKATLETLEQAVELGRRQIREARARKQQYVDMIARLQAENVKLQAKKELAATVGGLVSQDTKGDFEAARALYDRLRKRLEVENRMIDAHLARPAEAIPVEGIGADRDPLREIDTVLGEKPSESTPAAFETTGDADEGTPLELAARTGEGDPAPIR